MTKPDTIVVSNRGPLSFRFDAEHNLQPLAGGGGLVSALRPLLAGADTDAMWFSMTMGAADRGRGGGRSHARCRLSPCRSVTVDAEHLPHGLRRRRQHHPVVPATTTSSTCPAGPASTATGMRPGTATAAYNRAVADVVSAEAADAAAVLVQDYHFSLLGQMLAGVPPRSAHGPLLPHPLRRPEHAARAPRRRRRRAHGRSGRIRRLRLSRRALGRGIPRLLRPRRTGGIRHRPAHLRLLPLTRGDSCCRSGILPGPAPRR